MNLQTLEHRADSFGFGRPFGYDWDPEWVKRGTLRDHIISCHQRESLRRANEKRFPAIAKALGKIAEEYGKPRLMQGGVQRFEIAGYTFDLLEVPASLTIPVQFDERTVYASDDGNIIVHKFPSQNKKEKGPTLCEQVVTQLREAKRSVKKDSKDWKKLKAFQTLVVDIYDGNNALTSEEEKWN